MAKEYVIPIQGQPTRYSNQAREMTMYFAEPEQGARENSGILLLIAGYGGHGMSNVYQKMRRVFADQYDLVTLQCDYLGYRAMQNDHHLGITEKMLRKVLSPREFHNLRRDYAAHQHLLKGKVLSGYVTLEETADDFNEMGLWQAMDNLMAVKILFGIIQENGLEINRKRVYIYGQSHGAYLAYLCNYLAPGLFTGIIDNSAYLFPYYLEHDREVTKVGDTITLQKWYHYLAADQNRDRDSYDLRALYADFENHARIVAFHGEEDEMIPLNEKKKFLDSVQHVSLHVVTRDQVDGVVFQSAGHSLGADLLKVFDRGIKELEHTDWQMPESKAAVFVARVFQTEQYRYEISWQSGIPLLSCQKME